MEVLAPSFEGLTHPFADGHGLLGHGLRVGHGVLHDGLEELVLVLPFERRLWDGGPVEGRPAGLPTALTRGSLPGAPGSLHSGASNGQQPGLAPRPWRSEAPTDELEAGGGDTGEGGVDVEHGSLGISYLPGQHFVEQDSESPPVHRLPVGLISDDLENRRWPVRRGGPSRRRPAPIPLRRRRGVGGGGRGLPLPVPCLP